MLALVIASFAALCHAGSVPLANARSGTAALPQAGPCTQNNDGMKCTKHGYYDTIQCDSRGCFCVNAHNGIIAFDTKTSSNRTMPRCSGCHNSIKKMVGEGSITDGTFVPKCDAILGNFEPLQCDLKRKVCYCVDVQTGTEIANTRKSMAAKKSITCDGTEFSIDPEQFPSPVQSTMTADMRYPVAKESCRLDRNRGNTCRGAKASTRYFFDHTTFSCLSFEYLGCGGNDNNYKTSSDCYSNCMLLDMSGCSGMYPPARNADGATFICPLPSLPPGLTASSKPGPKLGKDGCPKDHKCVSGAFFGTCCSLANEDRFDAAYHPKCSNGRSAYAIDMGGWNSTVLGKSCKDNFCPHGYKCQDGDIFAYCC